MAKTAKKEAEITDTELQELENLETGAEPDEDGVEVEEAVSEKKPKNKKDKKNKKNKKNKEKAPRQSRAAANGKVGTQELVNYINENKLTEKPVDGRQLRMALRKLKIEKDPETNRYEWDSFDDKAPKAIIKEVKGGIVEKTKQEGLERLKEQKDAKANTKSDKKDKKDKKNKKNKS